MGRLTGSPSRVLRIVVRAVAPASRSKRGSAERRLEMISSKISSRVSIVVVGAGVRCEWPRRAAMMTLVLQVCCCGVGIVHRCGVIGGSRRGSLGQSKERDGARVRECNVGDCAVSLSVML